MEIDATSNRLHIRGTTNDLVRLIAALTESLNTAMDTTTGLSFGSVPVIVVRDGQPGAGSISFAIQDQKKV